MGSPQRQADFDELYQAILALPEGITGEILSDGRIETMGRPGDGHTRFAERARRRLFDLEDDPLGGWVFRTERELRIAIQRLVVPDLAGWRVLDEDAGFLEDYPISRVPDWTCEILSDSTWRRDREEKLPLYLSAGVGHVWLADPAERTIEVFVLGLSGQPVQVAFASGDGVVTLPPFDALSFDLRPLWSTDRRVARQDTREGR